MRPVDAAVRPVLERDLQRLLDRARRRRDAKRKCGSSTGTTRASASASSTTTRLPLPSIVEWAHPVELVAERVVELGDAVAERGDPQRRDGVEVAAAVDVDELVALGPLDDDRRVVGVATTSA